MSSSKSENDILIAQDSLPLGIFRSTPEGRYVSINVRMVDIFGYDSKEELLNVSIYDLYANPSRRKEIEKLLAEKQPNITYEVEMKRKDGTPIIVLARLGVERDANGKILYYNGIAEDITEKKKAEEELSKRIEFERIIAHISTKFIHLPINRIDEELQSAAETVGKLHNADNCFVALFDDERSSFERTYGYASIDGNDCNEAISNFDFHHYPWLRERIEKPSEMSITDTELLPPEAKLERDLLQSLGMRAMMTVPMICGEKFLGFVGLLSTGPRTDWTWHGLKLLRITADIFSNAIMRKWSVESLIYKARMLSNISEAVISTDKNMIIKSWNKAAEIIYGWKPEEVIGKNLNTVLRNEFCNSDMETVTSELINNHIWKGEAIEHTKDGRTLNMMVSISVITDEKSEPIGAVSIGRNITDQKIAERRLKEAYDELKAERKQLEQKNIALKEVLIHIEEEKQAVKEQVARAVDSVLLPALNRLIDDDGLVRQTCLDILKTGLSELASLSSGLTELYSRLSPREVEICSLIRAGSTSEEIANKLFISHATVKKHREKIRRKLNLKKRRVNLQTFLKSNTEDV